jgi:hypothetical protein
MRQSRSTCVPNKREATSATRASRFLITAGPGGLQIEAQIFDRTKQKWFPITQKIADGTDSKALAAEVTKEIIPQALVRILEFAGGNCGRLNDSFKPK